VVLYSVTVEMLTVDGGVDGSRRQRKRFASFSVSICSSYMHKYLVVSHIVILLFLNLIQFMRIIF